MVETHSKKQSSRGQVRRGRPAAQMVTGEAGNGAVQSLDRALRLLESISEHEHGVTLSDLAQETALPPSTAHRLLKSLEARQFVRQDSERGLWFIGVRAFTVGSAFVRMRDIVAIARPIIRRLVDEVEESANLAVLDGNRLVYLSQIECRQMIRAHALPGAGAMAHCSGVGKALLAALPDERALAIVAAAGMPALTEKTITDVDAYLTALATVRMQGYGVDDEEQSLGMRCVAAVVYDENADPVAAVSVTGPSARITSARIAALGAKVRAVADEVTAVVGGRHPN